MCMNSFLYQQVSFKSCILFCSDEIDSEMHAFRSRCILFKNQDWKQNLSSNLLPAVLGMSEICGHLGCIILHFRSDIKAIHVLKASINCAWILSKHVHDFFFASTSINKIRQIVLYWRMDYNIYSPKCWFEPLKLFWKHALVSHFLWKSEILSKTGFVEKLMTLLASLYVRNKYFLAGIILFQWSFLV